ncbi:PstS family phosphate ABC transporter substrate-binding protein [Stenomitos frigidus]|uniref:Phosphate-binding protein n=1 Tax=Stenomitos frigidus ULC18 TaxID=2107698 RepID=A0A2T1EN31_9CYAN|nr:PstS family phosphate ABC transporter substrate-binding protein [Stenomitos frigidus]PSB34136.1 ABC transporter substrate-binding protein [Stenomitos frigidus ULC18]
MLLFVSGTLSLTAGCTINSQASQNSVQIDGSSTVYPITQLAVTKFNTGELSHVSMTVRQAGTEAGFKSFCAGETAINDASRPILLREIDACKQNNVRYVELPIAFDALTVVVNAKNQWANDITTAELKKLWDPAAEGKIKTWNQIRAGWPNQPIHLYGPDKNSGTIDYFALALGLPEHGIRSDYIGDADARVLARKVGDDPAALGYFGYGAYRTNTNHLKPLAIDSGKGAVLPSVETVNNTRYQPFSRPLLLYVNIQSAQVNPNVKAFVEYYLGHTEELVKEADYFPLPEGAYHMNSVHFYDAKAGTVFAGAPQPGMTIPQLLRKQAIF